MIRTHGQLPWATSLVGLPRHEAVSSILRRRLPFNEGHLRTCSDPVVRQWHIADFLVDPFSGASSGTKRQISSTRTSPTAAGARATGSITAAAASAAHRDMGSVGIIDAEQDVEGRPWCDVPFHRQNQLGIGAFVFALALVVARVAAMAIGAEAAGRARFVGIARRLLRVEAESVCAVARQEYGCGDSSSSTMPTRWCRQEEGAEGGFTVSGRYGDQRRLHKHRPVLRQKTRSTPAGGSMNFRTFIEMSARLPGTIQVQSSRQYIRPLAMETDMGDRSERQSSVGHPATVGKPAGQQWADAAMGPVGRPVLAGKTRWHDAPAKPAQAPPKPARDEDLGTRVGSHPRDCSMSQDSDGRLHVQDETGALICTYEPAAFRAISDDGAGLVRLHRTGDWDLAEAMTVTPEQPAERESAATMRTHDSAVNMPAALQQQNARNREFWRDEAARVSTPSYAALAKGMTHPSNAESQMSKLKTINMLNRRRFGRGA